ncbi:MAG: hypothetical protein J0L92_06150 [Deltaproteobacteria bacterium]|nr:hypothetical protein [Deltaproteobacteria bacterium]
MKHTHITLTFALLTLSLAACDGRLAVIDAPTANDADTQPTQMPSDVPEVPVLDGDEPAGTSPSDTPTVLPSEGLCPPTGATGGELGQVSPDFTLPTDDGRTFSVRASCDRPVIVWRFSENCGICRRVLREDVNEMAASVRAMGGDFVVVFGTALTVDGVARTATLEDARRIREEFSVDTEIPIAVDVGVTRNLFYRQGSRYVLALRRGNVLAARYGRIEEPALRALIASMQADGI